MALDLNRIKTYFKDKIDWKFYEYLIYKITPLIDQGKLIDISICVDFDRFIIYDNEFGFINDGTPNRQAYLKSFVYLDNDTIEDYYKITGLFYQIYVRQEFISLGAPATSDDIVTLNKIWDLIEDKCVDERDDFDMTGVCCLYFTKK